MLKYRVFLLLGVCLLLVGRAPEGRAAEGEEYAVKAAFVFNFAGYTEWPVAKNTLTLCVLGSSPITAPMMRYAGRVVQGRQVAVKQVSGLAEAGNCDVLFVAATEHGRMEEVREQMRNRPILTVTESNGFDRNTVMLVMTPVENRLSFEVNQKLAESVGLKFSSKLLRLASKLY